MSIEEKEYKLSPEDRKYFREKRREARLKTHPCAVCNGPAWAKITLTGEYRCAKDIVAPLKQELTKKLEATKKSQNKTNAASANNQVQSTAPLANPQDVEQSKSQNSKT
jgi:hypothetical protein